jgi:ABC-type transport system involved in cytochrome bd biosynthesis fused ATPase/permease subunit
MVAKIAPYLDDRYLFCLYPVVSLVSVYVVWRLSALFIKNRRAVILGVCAVLMSLNILSWARGQANSYLYAEKRI